MEQQDLLQANQALKQSNEALQDLFDNSNDLIFVCNLHGNFLFANKVCQKKLGYSAEELQNINVNTLIHPNYKHQTRTNILRLMRRQILYKFETVLLSKKGKIIYLEGNVSCRFEQDKPIAIRGIMYDTTDKIRAEKAQTLYYSIANLTVKSNNLTQLYQNIHEELGKVIEVKNFYIKLYNHDKSEILFPYYVDEARKHEPIVRTRVAGKGLTDYVMERKKAVFLREKEIQELLEKEKLEVFGLPPKVWIGVPLTFEHEVIGLISVKSYTSEYTYNFADLELLDFISGQIALAIQRKKYEEQLANQKARLESIFESSSHMIWSLNRQYRLTSYNQNYWRFVQSQFPDADHNTVENITLSDRLSDAKLRRFWQQKYYSAFKGKPQHFEKLMPSPSNKWRWWEVFINPISLADGTIEEVSAIAHDITAKKNSEFALQKSEAKFRRIFESFQDLYYQADLQGNILIISPSILELTGYAQEEIIGKKLYDFTTNPTRWEDFKKNILENERVKNIETNIKAKTGNAIPTLSNIRLIYNEKNKAIGIEGVVRDITELKRATDSAFRAKELAERSLKVKERFLANMSHEIRTPMNGIIGMVDVVLDTPLSPELRDYIFTIKKSSETLLYILNDILDLSKLEAGKMKIYPKPIYIQQTIEKVYTLFRQQAESKENTLNFTFSNDFPQVILADETRLLQILSNLVANAIKFTEKGNITIACEYNQVLSIAPQPPKGAQTALTGEINNVLIPPLGVRGHSFGAGSGNGFVKITVKDTGIGIEKENLDLLFKNFNQLDTSWAKNYAGTGLGLAIAKELCKLMQGDIGVRSEVNKGSEFWFSFETKISQKMPEKSLDDTTELLFADFFKAENFKDKKDFPPKILIVDDNAINRKVAFEILKRANCIVEMAQSGQEAVDILTEKPGFFHLVFMDIQMPDIDGVQTLKKLKSIHAILPPMIAMTAYAMREDKRRFLKNGFDDYLSKPINAKKLLQKIAEILSPLTTKGGINTKDVEAVSSPFGGLGAIGAGVAIFNPQTLAQLRKYGSEEWLKETLVEFVQDTTNILLACKDCLAKNDFGQIKIYFHTLKGNAGTLGADYLAEYVGFLEKKLKENPKNIISAIEFNGILEIFEELKKSVENL